MEVAGTARPHEGTADEMKAGREEDFSDWTPRVFLHFKLERPSSP